MGGYWPDILVIGFGFEVAGQNQEPISDVKLYTIKFVVQISPKNAKIAIAIAVCFLPLFLNAKAKPSPTSTIPQLEGTKNVERKHSS